MWRYLDNSMTDRQTNRQTDLQSYSLSRYRDWKIWELMRIILICFMNHLLEWHQSHLFCNNKYITTSDRYYMGIDPPYLCEGIIFASNGVDCNANWTKNYIDTSECFVTKRNFRAFSFKCMNWFDLNHSRSRFVLGLNFGHFIRDCVGKFTAKMYNFKPKTNLHLEWFMSNQFIHLKEKALKFRLVKKHSLVSK